MIVRSQTRAERARCRRAVLADAKAARAACSCVLAACTRTRWRTGSARETKEQPRANLRSLSRALCAWRAIMTVAHALADACPREGRGTAEPMRLTGRVRRLRAHPAPCKPSAHPRPDIRRGSPAHTQCGAAITERARGLRAANRSRTSALAWHALRVCQRRDSASEPCPAVASNATPLVACLRSRTRTGALDAPSNAPARPPDGKVSTDSGSLDRRQVSFGRAIVIGSHDHHAYGTAAHVHA